LIQEIGSYAGFAAVVGLAVLSALYFSQARDVRRLRDWAGRAPERDAEARSRVAAVAEARQGAVAEPAQKAQPAAAAGGNSGAAAAAATGNSTAAPKPVTAAAAGPSAVSAASAAGAGSGGVASPPRPKPRIAASSGQTQILGKQQGPPERWYRRLAPRYIALIVAGVLVVGGGIAVGAIKLLSNDSSGGGTPSSQPQGGGDSGAGGNATPKKTAPPINPSTVHVAVFNGTQINGLARSYADKVQGLGFTPDAVGQVPAPSERAETVVLYKAGKKRQAILVRKKLKLGNIEQIDQQTQGLAPNADVVVVVGQNAAQ
jgi:hypothetical protein